MDHLYNYADIHKSVEACSIMLVLAFTIWMIMLILIHQVGAILLLRLMLKKNMNNYAQPLLMAINSHKNFLRSTYATCQGNTK